MMISKLIIECSNNEKFIKEFSILRSCFLSEKLFLKNSELKSSVHVEKTNKNHEIAIKIKQYELNKLIEKTEKLKSMINLCSDKFKEMNIVRKNLTTENKERNNLNYFLEMSNKEITYSILRIKFGIIKLFQYFKTDEVDELLKNLSKINNSNKYNLIDFNNENSKLLSKNNELYRIKEEFNTVEMINSLKSNESTLINDYYFETYKLKQDITSIKFNNNQVKKEIISSSTIMAKIYDYIKRFYLNTKTNLERQKNFKISVNQIDSQITNTNMPTENPKLSSNKRLPKLNRKSMYYKKLSIKSEQELQFLSKFKNSLNILFGMKILNYDNKDINDYKDKYENKNVDNFSSICKEILSTILIFYSDLISVFSKRSSGKMVTDNKSNNWNILEKREKNKTDKFEINIHNLGLNMIKTNSNLKKIESKGYVKDEYNNKTTNNKDYIGNIIMNLDKINSENGTTKNQKSNSSNEFRLLKQKVSLFKSKFNKFLQNYYNHSEVNTSKFNTNAKVNQKEKIHNLDVKKEKTYNNININEKLTNTHKIENESSLFSEEFDFKKSIIDKVDIEINDKKDNSYIDCLSQNDSFVTKDTTKELQKAKPLTKQQLKTKKLTESSITNTNETLNNFVNISKLMNLKLNFNKKNKTNNIRSIKDFSDSKNFKTLNLPTETIYFPGNIFSKNINKLTSNNPNKEKVKIKLAKNVVINEFVYNNKNIEKEYEIKEDRKMEHEQLLIRQRNQNNKYMADNNINLDDLSEKTSNSILTMENDTYRNNVNSTKLKCNKIKMNKQMIEKFPNKITKESLLELFKI